MTIRSLVLVSLEVLSRVELDWYMYKEEEEKEKKKKA